MRVLVVTSMYPTPSRPSLGGFVRDQVEALREIDGLEIELFAFEPGGWRRFARAGRDLRRAHGGDTFDLVHAHYGLTGFTALSLGRRVQPRERESNSSYFAGRNATWSTKATPATGWNE